MPDFFIMLAKNRLGTRLHSLRTKALIELLHSQNDIAFVVAAPFSPFVCKLARVAVLASCDSAKFQHDAILSTTQKVEVQTCAYCACVIHMQTHFTTVCL